MNNLLTKINKINNGDNTNAVNTFDTTAGGRRSGTLNKCYNKNMRELKRMKFNIF